MIFYDREGNPMTLNEWAAFFALDAYKIVERSEVGDILVSTIWVGIDHGLEGPPPRGLFETAIFGGDHDGVELRWDTELEARLGHQVAVELVLAAADTK